MLVQAAAAAATRTTSRNCLLRNSYVEISRFIRTQGHGTSLTLKWDSQRTRSFASCSSNQLEIDSSSQGLLKNHKNSGSFLTVLDQYKKTFNHKSEIGADDSISNLKAGEKHVVYGYLGARRDVSKALSFALLRGTDQFKCVQVVSSVQNAEGEDNQSHHDLRSLKEWTPVRIEGMVKKRKPPKDDKQFGMQLATDVEIELQSVQALNDMPADIIIQEGTVYPAESRHLELRTDSEARFALQFRAKLIQGIRNCLGAADFVEVETPMLFKSTPEGAREFLVPTRTKGLAYALPQSPQQYKQILMASGIPKYFQIARCFRDEDLRADRQPEFTQLDMEVAFENEHDVMRRMEVLLHNIWPKKSPVGLPDLKLPETFDRMTYHEAMASYGSDKPDLRFDMKIQNVTDIISPELVSKISPLENPMVQGLRLCLDGTPTQTRKFIANFLESPEGKPFMENTDGGPGIFICDPHRPMSGLDALGIDAIEKLPDALQPEAGDLLILQARKNEPFSGGSTPLGNLRLALRKAAAAAELTDELNPFDFKMVWITDFPLFSPSNDTDPGQGGSAGLSSTHHPFTAPKTAEDVDLLMEAPEKVIAAHYDLVCNGVELGGGSRRIHNAEVQEFVFRDVLKMSSERIEDFRHLLDVLKSGCPPHAGIALGLDRLVAVMLGYDSVRRVIAFPKNGKGEDALVKSPNALTKEQLKTYHLQLKD